MKTIYCALQWVSFSAIAMCAAAVSLGAGAAAVNAVCEALGVCGRWQALLVGVPTMFITSGATCLFIVAWLRKFQEQ